VAGIVFGLPAAFAMGRLADAAGAKVLLPVWLLALAACVTLTMAMVSGLAALRSLRQVEPAILLR
jgi:putative ABC transport system permease protein